MRRVTMPRPGETNDATGHIYELFGSRLSRGCLSVFRASYLQGIHRTQDYEDAAIVWDIKFRI